MIVYTFAEKKEASLSFPLSSFLPHKLDVLVLENQDGLDSLQLLLPELKMGCDLFSQQHFSDPTSEFSRKFQPMLKQIFNLFSSEAVRLFS